MNLNSIDNEIKINGGYKIVLEPKSQDNKIPSKEQINVSNMILKYRLANTDTLNCEINGSNSGELTVLIAKSTKYDERQLGT